MQFYRQFNWILNEMQIEYESFGLQNYTDRVQKMMDFHDYAQHTPRKFIKNQKHNNILFLESCDTMIIYA